jgi:hypothetical protein
MPCVYYLGFKAQPILLILGSFSFSMKTFLFKFYPFQVKPVEFAGRGLLLNAMTFVLHNYLSLDQYF